MEGVMNSIITIQITSTSDRGSDKKQVTFYIIEIYNHFSKKSWTIEKRYSEFDALYKTIYKLYPKCPTIPGKSFLGMGLKSQEKEKRKNQLDNFLKECAARKDIMNSEIFRDFIDFDKNSPENTSFTHQKINEFTELPLGVRDFVYLKYDKVCFVACSDMNITSRIDAYITNVNFPWEKKTDSHITVGAVFAFKTHEDPSTHEISFEKLWAKSYPIQTGVLAWDSESNTLAVGLDDGKIFFYKTSAESGYLYYEQICEIKPHTDRVMGIAIDAKAGYIYSVGSDKRFKVSEANFESATTEIAIASSGYTNLVHDKKNERLFSTTETGCVIIYSLQTVRNI